MKKRWYDTDATVSLAVSLISNSDDETKHLCAKEIIKIAKEHEVKLNSGLLRIVSTFKRWYDEDKYLCKAMEYFKASPLNLKKKIAVEIIELLQSSEKK